MRKVIFLDIDGVLNTQYWFGQRDRNISKDRWGYMFDPASVSNLASILEKTGAEIVISSSWKCIGISSLRDMWKERHLPGVIRDVTPDYMCDGLLLSPELSDADCLNARGSKIKGWLIKHRGEVSEYVIIDDMDDVLPEQQAHFVWTDSGVGISEEDAKKAIKILQGQ